MLDIGTFSALLGGLLTFLAPCTLPLIPAYIGFLGGTSFRANGGKELSSTLRMQIAVNALLFVLGFSLIFIFFGLVSGTVGKFLILHRAVLSQVAGLVVIFFGAVMLGYVTLPRFFSGRSLPSWLLPAQPFSAFLLGVLFAIGWSPCLGPILGTILLLAGQSGTALHGAYLLMIYSLGLGIPFLLVAVLYGSAFTYVERFARFLPAVSMVAGGFLVFIGILLLVGQFGLLNTWAAGFIGGEWYENLVQYM
jgi:cytochrome c-type biogenesis protein